jgi:hypothetical protein
MISIHTCRRPKNRSYTFCERVKASNSEYLFHKVFNEVTYRLKVKGKEWSVFLTVLSTLDVLLGGDDGDGDGDSDESDASTVCSFLTNVCELCFSRLCICILCRMNVRARRPKRNRL